MPNDPEWPAHFEIERARIVEALGDKARAIEHIGSTAVPGRCAKPIIDIMLLVTDLSDHDAFIPQLEAAEYVPRIGEPAPEPGSPFIGTEPHAVFKGSERDLNLHVWTEDSPTVCRQRLFRDWWRTHDDDRDLYASSKMSLRMQGFATVQAYADAKTPVSADILARAERAAELRESSSNRGHSQLADPQANRPTFPSDDCANTFLGRAAHSGHSFLRVVR